MRKILIATDFSEQSHAAIRHVLGLLRDSRLPYHIDLLHTYVVLQNDPALALALNDRLRESSRAGLTIEENFLRQQLTGTSFSYGLLSKMGSLKNVIGQLVCRGEYDLVVMGKDGGKHIEAVSALLKSLGCCPLLTTFDGVQTT